MQTLFRYNCAFLLSLSLLVAKPRVSSKNNQHSHAWNANLGDNLVSGGRLSATNALTISHMDYEVDPSLFSVVA